MGLFDKLKINKKTQSDEAYRAEDFVGEPRDDFKSKDYYLKHLKRIDEFLPDLESWIQDSSRTDEDRVRYCLGAEKRTYHRLCFYYVLRADEHMLREEAMNFCRTVRVEAELGGQLTYSNKVRVLAFCILFNINPEEVAFLKDYKTEEKYCDATYDLLMNALFYNQATTEKEYYFKDKGYFGDDYKEDTEGLMHAIHASGKEEKTDAFLKFLKDVKDKHYQRLLKHYEKVGEERYVYTGSYDYRLTAVAKVLDIDKDALKDSKYIAADLL